MSALNKARRNTVGGSLSEDALHFPQAVQAERLGVCTEDCSSTGHAATTTTEEEGEVRNYAIAIAMHPQATFTMKLCLKIMHK